MADPLYSRSQMSTVAAAAVAVSGCSAERERQFQKGLWLPDVQPILVQRERVVRHTRRRRHESRRQNGAAVARESAMAGKLKGPRRSSICEGCNGVLTGLAAPLVLSLHGKRRRGEERRGEESKSGGYLLSQQEDRKTLNRESPWRPSFKPIPGSNLLFQSRLLIASVGLSVRPSPPLPGGAVAVAMLMAVSHPSIHPPSALHPSRTYWTCLPSSPRRRLAGLSHSGSVTSSISILSERERAFSATPRNESNFAAEIGSEN